MMDVLEDLDRSHFQFVAFNDQVDVQISLHSFGSVCEGSEEFWLLWKGLLIFLIKPDFEHLVASVIDLENFGAKNLLHLQQDLKDHILLDYCSIFKDCSFTIGKSFAIFFSIASLLDLILSLLPLFLIFHSDRKSFKSFLSFTLSNLPVLF